MMPTWEKEFVLGRYNFTMEYHGGWRDLTWETIVPGVIWRKQSIAVAAFGVFFDVWW